jgi:uncharacterized protein (DUF488 family)
VSGRRAFTIGHSTHALDAFCALLDRHAVRRVADVRRFPGSRRHPQFGADALAAGLAAHGIGYTHIEALGGRRSVVPGSQNGGWENAAFRGYADHMATASFAAGLAELEALAAAQPTAVMCAEALPWRCHRRLIADALIVRGWTVRDIMGPGKVERHSVTPFARIEGDRLTYPAESLFPTEEP